MNQGYRMGWNAALRFVQHLLKTEAALGGKTEALQIAIRSMMIEPARNLVPGFDPEELRKRVDALPVERMQPAIPEVPGFSGKVRPR